MRSDPPNIQGTTTAGFEVVRQAFEANFTQRGERGAAVAVYRDGLPVVDLWGGTADADAVGGGRPWTARTAQVLRSATKGVSATVLLLLADRGLIDLDAPVADHWPEFGVHGKGRVTARQLLAHRAGLAALDEPLTAAQACDGRSGPAAVAAQRPWWEPGTAHGYHAQTYSWLIGELVRRVDGRTLGTVLAEEIAELLAADLWIGVPPDRQDRVGRIAPVEPPPPRGGAPRVRPRREVAEAYADPASLTRRAFGTVSPAPDENASAWRAAELPASSGIATARGLADFYAALGAGRILGRRMLAQARTEHSSGPDRVLLAKTRFGLGFMLHSPAAPMSSPAAFGHPGRGGSLAFADPELGLAFAYVTNGMRPGVTSDPRAQSLVRAVRQCLEAKAAVAA
ncbi:serine hydrolase domain-containing protein [Streptomyces cavernicola]|uniref:Serine hydrolase domain-containing protein n=1 Tax=Streptomyces cavernicola TaxID=3043613 RepID=A0ABT6SE33_9ACTN|nr:serine hydrolase domain-containing protein [Streptomyces sp. B-S-A6]MDI3406420.1 serine hydrolase domain-containing protein [Streptomyces sp. B-S-A6]